MLLNYSLVCVSEVKDRNELLSFDSSLFKKNVMNTLTLGPVCPGGRIIQKDSALRPDRGRQLGGEAAVVHKPALGNPFCIQSLRVPAVETLGSAPGPRGSTQTAERLFLYLGG